VFEASQASPRQRSGVGETIRQIADQLKQESDLQIKVTSRILGAAAQISENHDRLIEEVVDMAEEDLELKNNVIPISTFTAGDLKQQFKTLEKAKTHFGLKAGSWEGLAKKINDSVIQNQIAIAHPKVSVLERLDVIETEIKLLRLEISQILVLLQRLIANKR
jgi:hypothetical protein